MSNEIIIEKIQSISEMISQSKRNRKGYIMLPSINGFEMFEIDEERLKLYLQAERVNKNLIGTISSSSTTGNLVNDNSSTSTTTWQGGWICY